MIGRPLVVFNTLRTLCVCICLLGRVSACSAEQLNESQKETALVSWITKFVSQPAAFVMFEISLRPLQFLCRFSYCTTHDVILAFNFEIQETNLLGFSPIAVEAIFANMLITTR